MVVHNRNCTGKIWVQGKVLVSRLVSSLLTYGPYDYQRQPQVGHLLIGFILHMCNCTWMILYAIGFWIFYMPLLGSVVFKVRSTTHGIIEDMLVQRAPKRRDQIDRTNFEYSNITNFSIFSGYVNLPQDRISYTKLRWHTMVPPSRW